jgi:hypothetical protein
MSIRRRWVRILRVAAVIAFAMLAALAVFVQIQQHVLRWRAERLLADIRQIQMGKSTWADAQRLMTRWGEWGQWEGSCTVDGCNYEIEMQDTLQRVGTYFWERTPPEKREEKHFYRGWELRLYSLLGGRITQVRASIHLKNGVIWTKSYAVYTARSFYMYGVEEFLIGGAYGETRFLMPGFKTGLKLHPEYSIEAAGPCDGCNDGACTVCRMIGASFAPFAAPEVVNQLFDFKLTCITNWLQCDDPKETMPSAWRLYRHDQEELAKRSLEMDGRGWAVCDSSMAMCDSSIEMAARDCPFVMLTEVARVQTTPDSGRTRYTVSLRGIKSLKNSAAFGSGLVKEPLEGGIDTVLPGGIRVADLRPGNRVILFEWHLDDPALAPGAEPYLYIPDTDANQIAIQRGIERDKLADVP